MAKPLSRYPGGERTRADRAPRLQCSSCRNRSSGIFCELAGTHLKILERKRTVHTFNPAQTLFTEGTPAYAMYCICSGAVKLSKATNRGKDQIIRLLGPGDIAGYRAIVADEPYAATAVAVQPTTVCAIPRETVLCLLRNSPKVAIQLLSKMAQELRTSEELALELANVPVRRRVARTLLFLGSTARKTGKERRTIIAPLLRKEIAEMVGTTPETLSRTLRVFAKRGFLQLTRGSIRVVNATSLHAIARGGDS